MLAILLPLLAAIALICGMGAGAYLSLAGVFAIVFGADMHDRARHAGIVALLLGFMLFLACSASFVATTA